MYVLMNTDRLSPLSPNEQFSHCVVVILQALRMFLYLLTANAFYAIIKMKQKQTGSRGNVDVLRRNVGHVQCSLTDIHHLPVVYFWKKLPRGERSVWNHFTNFHLLKILWLTEVRYLRQWKKWNYGWKRKIRQIIHEIVICNIKQVNVCNVDAAWKYVQISLQENNLQERQQWWKHIVRSRRIRAMNIRKKWKKSITRDSFPIVDSHFHVKAFARRNYHWMKFRRELIVINKFIV